MRLFNLEAHISVIADIENIFTRLYPEIEITSWNISGHNKVFGREATPVEIINKNNWRHFNQSMIDDFHKRYDNFLQHFDGFICGFPPVFALLFEKYKKPIFMINATRYEMPFCWEPNAQLQKKLENSLLNMHQNGQLIAVSNNKADVGYLKAATGVSSHHIPSLCLYTDAKYQPNKDDFVINHRLQDRIPEINGTVHNKSLGFTSWQELYSYRGIIHIPYEISTMSIFEQYSANIPLFMPSKSYLKRLLLNKKIPFNGPYTRQDFAPKLEPILGESWPEYWLDHADYYDSENMPYIHYFDSVNEINTLINQVNTEQTSLRMQAWNKTRQNRVLTAWQKLLAPHYKQSVYQDVKGIGQINMQSDFGKQIYKLASNTHFNNYLEIGTWNGEGSTVCLMNGLMPRGDNSRLYSIELMPEMFTKAELFWSWLKQSKYSHHLILLNGKITDTGIMPSEEIENHPAYKKIKKHYQLYYHSDVENFNTAKNIANRLPPTIDVAVLDGGEFCSTAEFEYIRDNLSPKVFVLDDTSIIKCAHARQELIKSKDWITVYDEPTIRHGAAIFIHKSHENLLN